MTARHGGVVRRAPRLSPDERIAGHLTRVGRFARIDPRRGRPLPPLPRWAGMVGWAVFCGEVARRTRRAVGAAAASGR